jgi:outer membrane protein insertion porin family
VGIDPKTGVLRIPILEVRVQDIKVTGNVKTQTYVILREMRLKPGDVFNRNTLFADLRSIYDLDIFDREAAEPYRLEPGSDIGQVIITIPVKERKTGEVSVGVGYSTQNQLLGQVRVSERNFQGKGQTVSFMWEQSVNNGSSLELGFFEPWLDDKHTSLNLSLYDKLVFRFAGDTFGSSTGSSNYDERRQGGSATFGRPLDNTSRGFLTFRYESVYPNATTPLPFPLNQSGNITSGTFRITNSVRDSEIDPTRGSYGSYSLELGRATFESQTNLFTKLNGDFRQYFSPGQPRLDNFEPRPVFATRVKVGTYTGNVPFFEQYFLGGAESLRGFREDRFWGRYTFLASLEYRFPLGSSLTGVAFTDMGDAWGADEAYRSTTIFPQLPQHANFSPQLGYGLGVRVSTPIGPLRLDYGLSNEGSRAHFSIGHVF